MELVSPESALSKTLEKVRLASELSRSLVVLKWQKSSAVLATQLKGAGVVLTVNHGYQYPQWLVCRFISHINN